MKRVKNHSKQSKKSKKVAFSKSTNDIIRTLVETFQILTDEFGRLSLVTRFSVTFDVRTKTTKISNILNERLRQLKKNAVVILRSKLREESFFFHWNVKPCLELVLLSFSTALACPFCFFRSECGNKSSVPLACFF